MTAPYEMKGIRRGNSFVRIFRFKDAAGDPVDLTGSHIVFIATTNNTTPLRKTTEDGSLSMATPADGEVTLSLTPAETRTFFVGKLKNRFEFERHIGSEENTILSGYMVVEQGVNDDGD